MSRISKGCQVCVGWEMSEEFWGIEAMCDASDLAMGAVLGQREDGKPYMESFSRDKEEFILLDPPLTWKHSVHGWT